MHLILNKYAGGGSAKRKWEQIKTVICKRFEMLKVFDIQNHTELENAIKKAIETDNKKFIIAGGDGTLNKFINRLIDIVDKENLKSIKIGAIGIGSSNDFHKPIIMENQINEIPAKINFNDYELRDVGMIKYKSGSEILHKYFLLNASIGVTAEANNLFNNPDLVLRFLKKYFTGAAILYSAFKTIFLYKNIEAKIIFNSNEAYLFQISNLSIIKNPNISGDLSYPSDPDYQNGLYEIYLANSMNKFDLIKLLFLLSKKAFPKNEKTKYCRTSKIKVTAENNFLIEFDGEVIKTNYAEFSILNKYLNVCTS